MKVANNSKELIEAVQAGEECQLVERCLYFDLDDLTHLKGVRGAPGVNLHRLTSLKTLDGFVGAPYMNIRGLISLETLGDYKPVLTTGLFDLQILEVNPRYITDEEVDILKRIPLDKLVMEDWHSECGTVHCLAGWGQVLTMPKNERIHTPIDGFNALPSMSPYFYFVRGEDKIKEYILSLR